MNTTSYLMRGSRVEATFFCSYLTKWGRVRYDKCTYAHFQQNWCIIAGKKTDLP